MAYRKLNVSEELLGYARSVLERDGIPYEAAADGTLMADLDDEGEDILIEDAMCERQRADNDSEFPVYSYRTVFNREKFSRLQRLNWPDDKEPENAPFHPLREDAGLFVCEDELLDDEEELDEPIPGIEPGMSLAEALKIANEYYEKKWAEQS